MGAELQAPRPSRRWKTIMSGDLVAGPNGDTVVGSERAWLSKYAF
jgi:hypothetical protein